MQDKPTLCWRCANACGGCSWSADFTPVDGWDAVSTKIWASGGTIDSYRVKKCPKFDEDIRKYKAVDAGTVALSVIKVKRPPRKNPIRNTARWRLNQLPDLNERIGRLSGDERTIAELVFQYNNTVAEIADAMCIGCFAAEKRIYKTLKKMEEMK